MEELKEYCSMLYGITANERMFRFTKSFMEHEMVRGIKETGVRRIRLHDLRHSHASLLVEMGFQPLAIAERLGHEKIETRRMHFNNNNKDRHFEYGDEYKRNCLIFDDIPDEIRKAYNPFDSWGI